MQKILVIIHAAPYGSERCLSGLRLATALAASDDKPQVDVFLMSDGVFVGLPHQVDGQTKGLQELVEELVGMGTTLRLCRTCALARGISELPLIPGAVIGTLAELAALTLAADKVITF
jgi:uncharacterized protein involved in oxidation of intracellular sulfur